MVWDFWKFLATSMPEVREQQGRGGGGQIWYNIWSAVLSIKKRCYMNIVILRTYSYKEDGFV